MATALGLVVLLGVAVRVTDDSLFIGLLVVGPLVAASGAGPTRTGLVAAATTVAAVALLNFAGDAPDPMALALRAGPIAAAAGIAVAVSIVRLRNLRRIGALRAVAETAQRAILPALPDEACGVALAARYRSAAQTALVGGDLFEAQEVGGALIVLIGDVRGKGLGAVRLASVALGSFREAAHLAPDLDGMVAIMDASVAREGGDEDFVTALLIRIDGDRLELRSCGHPEPWLVPQVGEPTELALRSGPPLGLGGSAALARPLVRPWSSGDRLLAFTDGLAEARDRHGEFFPPALAADAARGPQRGLAAAVDEVVRLVDRHVRGRLRDDMAVVLLERREVSAGVRLDRPGGAHRQREGAEHA